MIRVCPHCSGVDVEGLKKEFPDEKVLVGCTGHCKTYKDKVYGYVDNEIIFAEYNKEFINKVKEVIQK